MNQQEPDPEPVALIEFADGQLRPVFQAADGQYVKDALGKKIYGVWFIPEESDRPAIVDDREF